jgi:hypothetical protein
VKTVFHEMILFGEKKKIIELVPIYLFGPRECAFVDYDFIEKTFFDEKELLNWFQFI